MISSTIEMLRMMKMPAMAAELEHQMEDHAYREMSLEERISLIVHAEWNKRQTNKINRLSNAAHFQIPAQRLKVWNILRIVNWINLRFYGFQLANISKMDAMSF